MEKAPVKHNRLRRMGTHDYTSACIYLITVTTVDRKRLLGRLTGNSADTAQVSPTALGEYVAQAFRKMAADTTSKTGSRVQVLHYKIMPDHFHGMLYVRDRLPAAYALGKLIAAWKSDCTHAYWKESAGLKTRELDEERKHRMESAGLKTRELDEEEKTKKGTESAGLKTRELDEEDSLRSTNFSLEGSPLFNRGFNDRILFRAGQKDAWIAYLDDNPRRLWLKVHYPDRLRKEYEFKTGKRGHQYTAIGDTFLVRYPERLQVRCHRNLTEEQIQAEVSTYLKEARRGTVLVSPFISPAEKAVYDACYKEKLKMIRVVNRGLDGKFIYPSGRDLKGCSEGFMLVLAPYADYSSETSAARITRSQCLDMNDFAEDIANVTLKCAERDEEEREARG